MEGFHVLLTMHLSTILDKDQLDARLIYFAISLLQSSTCISFEHYMLITSPSTCAPDGHWLGGRYQMLHEDNSTSSWWALNARIM